MCPVCTLRILPALGAFIACAAWGHYAKRHVGGSGPEAGHRLPQPLHGLLAGQGRNVNHVHGLKCKGCARSVPPLPSPAGGEGKIQEATALDPRSESGRTKGGGERFSRGFAPQDAVLCRRAEMASRRRRFAGGRGPLNEHRSCPGLCQRQSHGEVNVPAHSPRFMRFASSSSSLYSCESCPYASAWPC